jgi:hypothetical protein
LLIKDKHKRLGSQKGIKEIKSHPWLEDVSWDEIYQRNVKPPFIPKTYGE